MKPPIGPWFYMDDGRQFCLFQNGKSTIKITEGAIGADGTTRTIAFKGYWTVVEHSRATRAACASAGMTEVASGRGANVDRCERSGWQAPWGGARTEPPAAPPMITISPKWPAAFRMHVERMLAIRGTWASSSAVTAKTKVWRPSSARLVIAGDLVGDNLVIATGRDDFGIVVVTGSITCRNLVVGYGFSLVCAGAVTAKQAIVAASPDSTTYVAGKVTAKLAVSGEGAWLTLFAPNQLAAPVSGYVMVGAKPLRKPANLQRLVIAKALERDDDEVSVAISAATKIIVAGRTILR